MDSWRRAIAPSASGTDIDRSIRPLTVGAAIDPNRIGYTLVCKTAHGQKVINIMLIANAVPFAVCGAKAGR